MFTKKIFIAINTVEFYSSINLTLFILKISKPVLLCGSVIIFELNMLIDTVKFTNNKDKNGFSRSIILTLRKFG